MRKHVIIVAGGKGTRMGSEVPKQFLSIKGKPILLHTIEAFKNYDSSINVVLVLPKEQHFYWHEIEKTFILPKDFCSIADGGSSRFESVKNGLSLIKEAGLIAVHDGVRPLVDKATIDRCFTLAGEKGTAVPVINLTDSIRRLKGEESEAEVRSDFRLVQTPQVFQSDILRKAYNQHFDDKFTDDASVVESIGQKIYLCEGDINNIKITTPRDLKIAEVL